MTLDHIAAAVLVPVKQTTPNCRLEQATTDGWDRRLQLASDLARPSVFLPVTISARDAWQLRDGRLEVFDRGYLVDGACRLEAACRRGGPHSHPAIVLLASQAMTNFSFAPTLSTRSGFMGQANQGPARSTLARRDC